MLQPGWIYFGSLLIGGAARYAVSAIVLPLSLCLTAAAFAQDRPTLPEEEWYQDVKKELIAHYTGKTVRPRVTIPARRGLQILDGVPQNVPAPNSQPVAARIGEELVIKGVRIKNNEIELVFGKDGGKDESPSKWHLTDLFSSDKSPRSLFQFSYELTAKDLTVESLDRVFEVVFDLNPSDPRVEAATIPGGVPGGTRAPVSETPEVPEVIEELPALGPSVGELTIECVNKGARVYVDGAYSGIAPRIILLRTGVHTIMVISEGYEAWEQRVRIPGGKRSVMHAELRRALR